MRIFLYVFCVLLLLSCRTSSLYRGTKSANNPKVLSVPERTIIFSGYEWTVRDSRQKPQGPGGNIFAASEDNVWVDETGRLHLKITHRNGKWQCAEVRLKSPLGFGTYTFQVQTDVSSLDENVVAGFFTYLHDKAEIDIELSKWSKPDNLNAQYVVQPAEKEGNIHRFDIAPAFDHTRHSFQWGAGSIHFKSSGFRNAAEQTLSQWVYKGPDIPKEDKERLSINLWLYKGQAPKNAQEVEIIVNAVDFNP